MKFFSDIKEEDHFNYGRYMYTTDFTNNNDITLLNFINKICFNFVKMSRKKRL